MEKKEKKFLEEYWEILERISKNNSEWEKWTSQELKEEIKSITESGVYQAFKKLYKSTIEIKYSDFKKDFPNLKKGFILDLHQNLNNFLAIQDQFSDLKFQHKKTTDKNSELEKKKLSLTGYLTYYQDQDDKLRATIKDLQNQIKNHACSGCYISTHTDYDQVKQELATSQNKIAEKKTEIKHLEQELEEKNNLIQEQERIITELRKKPPVDPGPVDSQEPQSIKTKEERLLEVIKKQKEIIVELEKINKCRNCENCAEIEKQKNSNLANELVKAERERERERAELCFALMTILIAVNFLIIICYQVKNNNEIKKKKKKPGSFKG